MIEKPALVEDGSLLGCCHAVSIIYYNQDRPENHVDECYRITTFLKPYNHILYPTQGRECWPRRDLAPVNPPDPVYRHKGKRPMLRRKEAGEEVGYTKGKVNRKGLKITCSTCGAIGHNKRFHLSQVCNGV